MGVVVGVDGGNSKTELVLATTDGEVIALTRGPGTNSHGVGADGAARVIRELAGDATPELGVYYLCGADSAGDIADLEAELAGIAARTIVDNDTLALLRAGSEASNAIAVVCGAGLNCVGRAGDALVRYPALGWETGDRGGGEQLGRDAIFHAARAEDGRGGPTALVEAIRSHFAAASVEAVGAAFHYRRYPVSRLGEIAPLVIDAAGEGDEIARSLVERLAGEIVLLVQRAVADLGIDEAEVVLGGGLLQDAERRSLAELVTARLREGCRPVVLDAPPVLGAVLAALDEAGAGDEAKRRVREALRG
ncbi:MAG TPA: BadF/BadG/BcrA/BcrD ATPase family protein [Gaiellaceae bacterium]|nr:BadF/BadG/BcrA/BcrD ATPase family protein [Gaiellaceae bacterium]